MKYLFPSKRKADKHGQRLKAGVCVPMGAHLPTGSVRKYNIALLVAALDERHARVLLPVPHGLLEHGSLRACNNNWRRLNQRFFPNCSFLLVINTRNIGLEAAGGSWSPVCPSSPMHGKIPAEGILRPSVHHNLCAYKGAHTAWHTPVIIKPAIKTTTMLHQRKTAEEIQLCSCACISRTFAKQFPRWNCQVNHIGGGKKNKTERKRTNKIE